MKSKLLTSSPFPVAEIKQKYNSINGNDAEILSASALVNAFNGEIRWGSRNEDGSKIDLIISYPHPWNDDRIILMIQVKSGNQYGKIENGFFKVYKKSFNEVQRTYNQICLIWLDRETSENYWAFIHPNTSSNLTIYGKNHLLTPAIRFEIARNLTRNQSTRNIGGKGIMINLNSSQSPINSKRKEARHLYKNLNTLESPMFGNIEFTELGWKHMFRSSRKMKYKSHSLRVIPLLKSFLKQYPSRHWIKNFTRYNKGEMEFCQYEYLLSYEDVKNSENDKKIKVNVTILEEIGYPKKWKSESLLSQKIIRRVVFQSCSIKNIV